MNKFIKQELQKVNIPLPKWDDTTTQIVIYRDKHQAADELVIGGSYQFYIEDYVVHPSGTFTLAANWNNGTNPPETAVKGTVVQTMGKMVKIDCIGETTHEKWCGWIPKKCLRVLR